MKVPLTGGIFWVGVVDWNVRDFHGYTTRRGSTYNAYLVVDEKIALVDSVKAPFRERLLEHVAEHVDPKSIDFIISNHTEPDHSGSLYYMAQAAPNAALIASGRGVKGLEAYYGSCREIREVKTGNELSLGKRTLQFITTPMLHWPDSMATYVPEEKLLFSMDAFGQHLASSGRFDDEVPFDVLMAEAKTYYANIIMHLGKIVAKTLDAAKGLDIETIAPSHGVILRKRIPEMLSAHADWAKCKPAAKVIIVYDTMWQSTETMAHAILRGVASKDVECKLLKVTNNDLTDLATEMLDTACVAVGTPTLNNGMMPPIAAFLTYIMGLKPAGKVGLTFGSHGWSGGGAVQAAEMLQKATVELMNDPITCVLRPDEAVIQRCEEAGVALAAKALELAGKN